SGTRASEAAGAAVHGKRRANSGVAGFIVRTAAEGVGADEILADTRYLRRLWRKLEERIRDNKAPSVVYDELPLSLRTLRDYARPEVSKIFIDSRETFQKIEQFVNQYVPEVADRIEYYPGPRPLFELYSV